MFFIFVYIYVVQWLFLEQGTRRSLNNHAQVKNKKPAKLRVRNRVPRHKFSTQVLSAPPFSLRQSLLNNAKNLYRIFFLAFFFDTQTHPIREKAASDNWAFDALTAAPRLLSSIAPEQFRQRQRQQRR